MVEVHGETSHALVADNGVVLNGTALVAPIALTRYSWFTFGYAFGIQLNGTDLTGLALEGTVLSGQQPDGARVEGLDFVGARTDVLHEDGSSTALRIDAIEPLDAPKRRRGRDAGIDGVWLYTVSYSTDGGGGWQPLCGTDESGAPVAAIPVMGRWDERQGVPGGGSYTPDPQVFTFACAHGAVAKCIELGYQPWRKVKSCEGRGCDEIPLAGHLEACTRLLRADYCGDGRSWTVNGVAVDVYDDVGIQRAEEKWPVEAEWTADGARCVEHPRVADAAHTPPCLDALRRRDCGRPSSFRKEGTLLMNDSQPSRRRR